MLKCLRVNRLYGASSYLNFNIVQSDNVNIFFPLRLMYNPTLVPIHFQRTGYSFIGGIIKVSCSDTKVNSNLNRSTVTAEHLNASGRSEQSNCVTLFVASPYFKGNRFVVPGGLSHWVCTRLMGLFCKQNNCKRDENTVRDPTSRTAFLDNMDCRQRSLAYPTYCL